MVVVVEVVVVEVVEEALELMKGATGKDNKTTKLPTALLSFPLGCRWGYRNGLQQECCGPTKAKSGGNRAVFTTLSSLKLQILNSERHMGQKDPRLLPARFR